DRRGTLPEATTAAVSDRYRRCHSTSSYRTRFPHEGASRAARCKGSAYVIRVGSPKLIALGSAKVIALGSAKLIALVVLGAALVGPFAGCATVVGRQQVAGGLSSASRRGDRHGQTGGPRCIGCRTWCGCTDGRRARGRWRGSCR